MLVGTTIDGRKLITIGELSELYSVSKRSLRIYHDMGLLVPEYVDHQTGYRYYTPRQFPQLESILQMRALGLSLNNILVILKQRDVFVKRKCEQKGPKKVSTFSTRFHVVSNVFPKYQMLTF